MEPLTWMADPSERELRAALDGVLPELAHDSIALRAEARRGDPTWHSGTAVIGGAFVAKFAWSQVAAGRIHREGQVLLALGSAAPQLQLPEVVAISTDPVLIVTRVVPGAPLTGAGIATLGDAGSDQVAADLAAFLSGLHDPSVLDQVRQAVPMVAPEPQADTTSLRRRFGRWVTAKQRDAVIGWCDWVDAVLTDPSPSEVLVHGDLHVHNQVWDLKAPALRAVVDFDIAGPRDAEFDLRYLPAQAPGSDLFAAAVRHYQEQSGRPLDLDRVMAWHIRTALGDALWRSEAGIALPGGGDPSTYVDELAQRMRETGVEPAHP
jgi:aminoglycoside phosphotransferase (APT) family kinase protein